MAQSQYKAYVSYVNQLNYGADSPVCSGWVRTALLNNLIHLYDQHSQVRVCFVDTNAVISPSGMDGTNWVRVIDPIPFLTHMNHVGDPFSWRVRLAACSGSGATTDYRVVIGTQATNATDIRVGTSLTNVAGVTGVTSNTQAWLTLDKILLSLDGSKARSGVSTAYGGMSSTSATSYDEAPQVLELAVEVWARLTAGSTPAEVSGLVVQEFSG